MKRNGGGLILAALLTMPVAARAFADESSPSSTPSSQPQLTPTPSTETETESESEAQPLEATAPTPTPTGAPAQSEQAFFFNGYVDIGFAHADGDGTSFSPNDTRAPLDYGSDTFATAVNSRGDVASTNAGDRFTNHFLPYSVGIDGKPSFLVNTVDADLRYSPAQAPYMLFARVQVLPRFEPTGDATRVVVEQAFGRISPFNRAEFAISIGKFDPVFGIEYLENEAPLRTNITPSLIARYTTGQQLGVKALYRKQIPALASAVSINIAGTNNSSEVEALQPAEVSLTGVPVGSVRLGYELGLEHVQLKLGTSGMYGPRNDQRDPGVLQMAVDADARLYVYGLSIAAEGIWLNQSEGTSADKLTGTGEGQFASAFFVRGFYTELNYGFDLGLSGLKKVTPYAVYSWRHAGFQGFTPITVDRFTFGLRLDLWENLAFKAEVLLNRELAGAPTVDNNVQTTSLVFSW
jgi:hypothetical protein